MNPDPAPGGGKTPGYSCGTAEKIEGCPTHEAKPIPQRVNTMP